MPTPSTRLGLLKPTTSDPFSTQDLADNWQRIDNCPGTHICTSTTRPSSTSVPPWGSAQMGREIIETDTNLKWRWTGTAFVRAAPSGLLKTSAGAWARTTRTTAFSTTSATPVVVCSVVNVVVPAGLRPLQITVSYPRVTNHSSDSALFIYRSATSNSGTVLTGWHVVGDDVSPIAPGAQGSGGSFVTYEPDGLAAGTWSWSLQCKSYGSTTTIPANSTTTTDISIVEL